MFEAHILDSEFGMPGPNFVKRTLLNEALWICSSLVTPFVPLSSLSCLHVPLPNLIISYLTSFLLFPASAFHPPANVAMAFGCASGLLLVIEEDRGSLIGSLCIRVGLAKVRAALVFVVMKVVGVMVTTRWQRRQHHRANIVVAWLIAINDDDKAGSFVAVVLVLVAICRWHHEHRPHP